jgi:hypothetical protein
LRRLAGKIPTTPIKSNTQGAGIEVAKVLVNFAVQNTFCKSGVCGA